MLAKRRPNAFLYRIHLVNVCTLITDKLFLYHANYKETKRTRLDKIKSEHIPRFRHFKLELDLVAFRSLFVQPYFRPWSVKLILSPKPPDCL